MNCSIIASLIFLIGAGSLFLSVFFWKKSKKTIICFTMDNNFNNSFKLLSHIDFWNISGTLHSN